MDEGRRNFLRTGIAGLFGLGIRGHDAPPPAHPVAVSPFKEKPITHLPDTYEGMLALSTEQKILIAAAVASGCDAVAYYKADGNGFSLDKHIDLYKPQETLFPQTPGAGGYRIPVMAAGGNAKGIVVLHPCDTAYFKLEPLECRRAKLAMAKHIIDMNADRFGLSGGIVRQGVQRNDEEKKHTFFMTLIKDMFATFTSKPELMAEAGEKKNALVAIGKAGNAAELKTALRNAERYTDSNQYSHVLGVTDLMEHALKAINANAARPVMNNTQIDTMLLLTLLHDVGKTQMPSQIFTSKWDESVVAGRELDVARNGRHPMFTLLTLLLYPQEALTAAAHHHGIVRYGPREIADKKAKKEITAGFNDFTAMKHNVAPHQLPALSKLMRVADVTEAMTGRPGAPLHVAMQWLANKVEFGQDGKVVINPDTIDPRYLCFFIANGVFEAYGKQRAEQDGGWITQRKGNEGQSRYNPAEMKRVGGKILEKFGWTPENQAQKSQEIRDEIAKDALLQLPLAMAKINQGMVG